MKYSVTVQVFYDKLNQELEPGSILSFPDWNRRMEQKAEELHDWWLVHIDIPDHIYQ